MELAAAESNSADAECKLNSQVRKQLQLCGVSGDLAV